MKLNFLVLFRCHIQVRLLKLPQFTCAIHSRAKCFLKFRGPKLGCALDSHKYGILHPSTVHLHFKTLTARKQSSDVHSQVALSISLHLCFKSVIMSEKYCITSNLRCTFLTFYQMEN